MKYLYTTFIFLFLSFTSFGQSRSLDSLKSLLPIQDGEARLYTLLELSYESFNFNIDEAHQYARKALQEARVLGNKPGEKHALSLIGEYYYNITDYVLARNFLRQADRISLKDGGKLYSGYNDILWANIYLEESNFDSAGFYFKRSLSLIEHEKNYKIWYYCYYCYSSFLYDQNQIEGSREILEMLYTAAVKQNQTADQAEILIELGGIENKKDNYLKAKEYLAKAKPLLPGPGYSYIRLIYYYRLGYIEHNLGNNLAAITYLKAVLSTKEIEQYEEIKADMMALAGKIYVERGELGQALTSYLDAAKIYERLNLRRDLGRTYSDIAWLYFKQFNDAETVNFVHKALEIGVETQDDFGVAFAHSILGTLYAHQGKYPEAIRKHEYALDIRKRLQTRSRIADSYYNLGTAYEKSGQIDKALYYAQLCMEMDESMGNVISKGMSYKKIAALYLKKGAYPLAKTYLEKASELANQTASPELIRDVAFLFASLYEKTGDLASANQYLYAGIRANDSLYTITSVEKIAEIRGLYDLENIELRSKQRDQELALKQIEMDNQQAYNLFALIILILMTVLLIVGSYFYNTSRKSNVKLREEITERKKAEARLEEAQSLAQVGSWEFNLQTGELEWSKETYRIFELESYPIAELYEAYRAKCHAEDLPKLDEAIQNTIKTGAPFNFEHRIVCKDGSIKYLACIGEAIKDKTGNIIGLQGTDQDITLQKQAALAKSEFLSSMSHEIRTPINGVIGISNLLMAENLNETQQEYVRTLQFSAQHLSSIVTDILDFSKIESGRLIFEKLPFNLREVTENLYKLFESQAQEKQLQLVFSPDPAIDMGLSGDYFRLSQVLSNLLSNAIKFTEKGQVAFGYRLLETTEQQVKVEFRIQDTGIGISHQQYDRIFDNFSQADESISRKYGGTGLGLTISKKLIEQQGGAIRVESSLGEGATFLVELSFDKLPQNSPVGAAVHSKQGSQDQLKGMNILIAEDNKVNILVLTNLLKKWGATFTIANDGQEALEYLRKAPFDAVLMDIQMPVIDGREATRLIRLSAEERIQKLPIIAFTADAALESHADFLKTGFNDSLTKPFEPEQLLGILRGYWVG